MLRSVGFVIIIFASLFSIGQSKDTLQVVWKQDTVIRGSFDSFQVDILGNVYTVQDDVVKKYNAFGDTLFTQSIKYLGDVTAMDVGQSFKPVLFYQDQQTLIYLDNTLSQNSIVQLEEKDIYLAQLVALSYTQNTLWIYDQSNFSLNKFDVNLNKIVTIDNLTQQLNMEMEPTYIKEFDDYLYINNPEFGVLVFDLFGTFVKTIPIKNAEFLGVDNNNIYYVKDGSLYAYNQKEFETSKVEIPVKDLIGFAVSKDKFYFQNPDGIFVFVGEE